ncbi:hypothetical protein BS47DRAFT_1351975 [Hydnum rufescens UP504]|uniref:Uncharacterized protein n=1 Tax=Hydnum rufescens UP504 TaxID=1448309 RepID=A0A9P6DQB9_9AGAM|nr:hypothetical protein BS47DRAFT_1351975 [Hydnum rufescens UP504]
MPLSACYCVTMLAKYVPIVCLVMHAMLDHLILYLALQSTHANETAGEACYTNPP